MEQLSPAELFEEALRLNLPGLTRHMVEVVREFAPVPCVIGDRHKVLQILVNLLKNAEQAMHGNAADQRRIVLRLEHEEGNVRFIVEDNGVGIPAENLTRIFSHGFTTRAGGHAFGLHSSANAAQEMNGSLLARSNGPGHGAIFILSLPVAQQSAP
jgi:signal transduction histidine kinase